MRFRSFLLTLPVLIALTPAVTQAKEEGVAAVEAAWKKAAEANDVDALVACYAPDAVAWFPDMPEARGTEEIRAAWEEFLGMFTIHEAVYTESNAVTLGDKSVGWGTFSMTMTPAEGGEAITSTGRYTEIVEKRDGKWVYVVDHASMDPMMDEETDD